MLCRPLRLPTMYDGDQKLKPRSSEKNSNEFLAEETKGRDPPRHSGFKDFLIRNFCANIFLQSSYLVKNSQLLKYGFYKKFFDRNEPLTTFVPRFFPSRINLRFVL